MLSEYSSTSYANLSAKLAQIVSKNELENPLLPTWIVVQNKEAEHWLKVAIAKENGLSANFKFIFPSELMWTLFRIKYNHTPKNLPSDRIPIFWNVFDVLDSSNLEIIQKSGFPYENIDDKARYQLASQISDVFDLYQVYRPEMIKNWENKPHLITDRNERWQSVLWNILKENWSYSYPELPTRVDAFYQLISEFEANGIQNSLLPSEIYVFCLSHFSAPFAKLLGAISNQIDIHLFSKEIITIDQSVNDSLSNIITEWGKLKTTSYSLLSEIENRTVTFLPSNEQSILKNISSISDKDSGFKIHSCHNSKRESEVLKDNLLSFLDKNKSVSLDECLILVPDMEKYAPIIESVFSQNKGETQIPISLPYLNSQSSIKDLNTLLDLVTSSFKCSSFLDFIDSDLIRTNFDLSIDDIDLTTTWFIDNYTHWGLQETDSKYSLESLIKNLMSGFAMEAEPLGIYDSMVPYPKISSTSDKNLLAKLSYIVNSLIDFREDMYVEKSVVTWIETLEKWIKMLSINTLESTTNLIHTSLQKLKEKCAYSNSKNTISFSLFKKWLTSQLSVVSASSGSFGHGIILSSYVPYRNVPYKFIAILGFNESVFPRNPIRPSFDLIHLEPQSGERIMVEDDRLLFLETLQSAEYELFISYEGQDQHTENNRLPSILLQIMVTVLVDLNKSFVVEKHKLHGFNSSYFIDKKSYSESKKELAFNTLQSNIKTDVFVEEILPIKPNVELDKIDINDFISFFTNPSKYYANKELNLSVSYEKSDTEDREVFNLTSLSKFKLEQSIFDRIRTIKDSQIVLDYYSTIGLIPEGLTGDFEFEESWKNLHELDKRVEPFITEEEQTVDVDLKIGDNTLFGTISGLFGNRRVQVRTGSIRPKDLIPIWINHLILNVLDIEFKESLFVGKNTKNKVVSISTEQFFSVKNAEKILEELIAWYLESTKKSSLCFFPESSLAYVEAMNGNKEPLNEALKKWEGDDFSFYADSKDYYNSLIWRDENPISRKEFSENAQTFFSPLLLNRVVK